MKFLVILLVCLQYKIVAALPRTFFGANALNLVPQDTHAPYNDYDNHYGPDYHDEIHIDIHKDTLSLIKMKMQELQILKAALKQNLADKAMKLKEKLLLPKKHLKAPSNLVLEYMNPEVYHQHDHHEEYSSEGYGHNQPYSHQQYYRHAEEFDPYYGN